MRGVKGNGKGRKEGKEREEPQVTVKPRPLRALLYATARATVPDLIRHILRTVTYSMLGTTENLTALVQ